MSIKQTQVAEPELKIRISNPPFGWDAIQALYQPGQPEIALREKK